MASVIKKTSGIATVGELIKVLSKFPAEMPISVGGDNEATVYQAVPNKGEFYEDKRGEICIEGADPWA